MSKLENSAGLDKVDAGDGNDATSQARCNSAPVEPATPITDGATQYATIWYEGHRRERPVVDAKLVSQLEAHARALEVGLQETQLCVVDMLREHKLHGHITDAKVRWDIHVLPKIESLFADWRAFCREHGQ